MVNISFNRQAIFNGKPLDLKPNPNPPKTDDTNDQKKPPIDDGYHQIIGDEPKIGQPRDRDPNMDTNIHYKA